MDVLSMAAALHPVPQTAAAAQPPCETGLQELSNCSQCCIQEEGKVLGRSWLLPQGSGGKLEWDGVLMVVLPLSFPLIL